MTPAPEEFDIESRAVARIEVAENDDDAGRLAALEGLSDWLEAELEQATPPGR
jgi:hypothetical protein